MEQTFHDLYWKRQTKPGWFSFVLWMFVETAVGIVRERVLLLSEGDMVKNIFANPTSAAITSSILSLPLGLTIAAFMWDIEPLTKVLNNLLTMDGQQINMLGRIVIYGGLLLLPLLFVLNLWPRLKKEGPEGKESFTQSISLWGHPSPASHIHVGWTAPGRNLLSTRNPLRLIENFFGSHHYSQRRR